MTHLTKCAVWGQREPYRRVMAGGEGCVGGWCGEGGGEQPKRWRCAVAANAIGVQQTGSDRANYGLG